jgi:hypothetical protein
LVVVLAIIFCPFIVVVRNTASGGGSSSWGATVVGLHRRSRAQTTVWALFRVLGPLFRVSGGHLSLSSFPFRTRSLVFLVKVSKRT